MSILDDIDVQIANTDKMFKAVIARWLKANVKSIEENKLKFDFSTTPFTVDYDGDIEFKTHISSLTNGNFQWGEVDGNFFCCDCLNLKSFEGAAKNISGNYYCVNCHSLSLDNVSEKIKEKVVFNCEECDKYGLFGFWHFTLDKEDETIKDLLPKSYVKINDEYNCVTPDFLEKVKDVYLNKVMPSIRDMVNSHWLIKYLICIIKNIPIHFGRQEDYEDYDDGKYLGLYRRNKDNTREIILFEDAIKLEATYCEEYAVYDNEYLENLIWKVIIHEYAHAMMDTLQDDKIKTQDPKLYKYREESLANAFALKVLKSSRFGFSKIEDFVNSQPEEYRHGLDLYESEYSLKMMEFWREMKIEGNKRFK